MSSFFLLLGIVIIYHLLLYDKASSDEDALSLILIIKYAVAIAIPQF